ncbi:MAG: prepilin-type N-terminal cleavage/methylation domain-containing protein [Planctomycetota bacterium]
MPYVERSESQHAWFDLPSRCRFDRGVPRSALKFESDGRLYRFGCSICYDAAFTEHSRMVMQSGPVDFFVHCGSETADNRGVLQKHLLCMARLRAIETRRPILRNASGGYSGIIDSSGRFTPVAEPAINRVVLTGPLPLDDRPSPYIAWGDVLTPLVAVGCFAGWGLGLLGRNGRIRLGCTLSAGAKMLRRTSVRPACNGFSLLELLAVVSILGLLAAVVVPRVANSTDKAKEKVDAHNRGVINASVERYYLEKGEWPALDLSDIGSDPNYFPEGVPTNPTNGLAYTLNATTYRVVVTGGGGGK